MRYLFNTTDVQPMDRTPHHVERFYDRSWRGWTGYVANAAGDQISDAIHDHFKRGIPMDVTAYTLHT